MLSIPEGFRQVLLTAVIILLALPVGVAAEEITVSTAKGEVTLPGVPARIATLDPNVLENLHALGVEVAGVPSSSNLPGYLDGVRDSNPAEIGTLFEADLDAIRELDPDLVIVALRSARQYDAISEIATTIDLSPDSENYVPSALQNLRTLGKITGKEAEASALAESITESIAELKTRFATAGTSMLVLVNNGTILPVTENSRQGWPYKELGLVKANQDELKVRDNGRPEPITAEFILEKNPDWLFVVDRTAATGGDGVLAAEALDNEAVAATNAAKKGQIVYLTPYAWYVSGNGVLSLQDAVNQFSALVE